MGSLLDKVSTEENDEMITSDDVVASLKSKKTHGKNRVISAVVNGENWEKFKVINEKRSMSNSKMLNLMIADYIIEHETLLK